MISGAEFLNACNEHGFGFFSGVPCSYLTPLINTVISDPGTRYVGATSEGEAIAIAAGGVLAGRKSVAMCQNSGLGNMVNALTSLTYPFRLPVLLVVTRRGEPGQVDEPQHELMGEITPDLLDLLRVPHRRFPAATSAIGAAFAAAADAMRSERLPFAMVMSKGDVAPEEMRRESVQANGVGQMMNYQVRSTRPARADVLESMLTLLPRSAVVVAGTGMCGRELFTLNDSEQNLYLVGSMGCASAIGLGISLNTKQKVVIVDGDGAALMKLGNMATIGHRGPGNLIHIVLDNGVHDSTGGQPTSSNVVSFTTIAVGAGYKSAAVCDDQAGFMRAFKASLAMDGPSLIHVKIRPGSMAKLGRPTISPREVAARLSGFIAAANTESLRADVASCGADA